MLIFLKYTKYKYSIKLYVFNSNIADDGNPETPSPLESANVGNFDPKKANVLYGQSLYVNALS